MSGCFPLRSNRLKRKYNLINNSYNAIRICYVCNENFTIDKSSVYYKDNVKVLLCSRCNFEYMKWDEDKTKKNRKPLLGLYKNPENL